MPPKKGVLNRFSAFLASESLSLAKAGGSGNTPSPSPTRAGAAAGANDQKQQEGSSISPAPHQDDFVSSGSGGGAGGGGGGGVKKSPSASVDAPASPMMGPLESMSNSFASSANNSLVPRRSEDGASSGAPGLHGNDGSSNGAAAQGGGSGGNDAFKMFSIVGPTFAAGGSADDVGALNHENSAAAAAASTAGAKNNASAASFGSVGGRRRGASVLIAAAGGNKPMSPHAPAAAQQQHSQTPRQRRGSTLGHDSHDLLSPTTVASSPDHHDGADDGELDEEERTKRFESRLAQLGAFFEQDGVQQALTDDCSVSPARQRDILARVAESDHDIELAIATLEMAYGLGAEKKMTTPESNSGGNSGRDAENAAAAAAAAESSVEMSMSPTTLRRKRSNTVAKADIHTLLGPLLPEISKSVRPLSRKTSMRKTPRKGAGDGDATQGEEDSSSASPASDASNDTKEGQDGGNASSSSNVGKTINTGNVHGNRYISVPPGTTPQRWFFFGGETAVVDYKQEAVVFGATAALHSIAVPPPSEKHCAREQELEDTSLLDLVREQLSQADGKVMRGHSPSSSLSSELSGRSFGEMVDLEEMLRSLQ